MTFPELVVHLFVPHHSNNHRSKVLHIDALLLYVLVFAVFNLGLRFIHQAMPDVLGYATDIQVQQLLADTNSQRAALGLSPLTLNSELSAAAAAKAQDMFAKDYWAHNSPTGSTPWDFITGAGYHYILAGENLAKNFSTSDAVVSAWMASPSHRANMVKPGYKDIGFAVVNGKLNGEDTTLVVQMFGSSEQSIAVQPAPPPVLVGEALAVNNAPQSAPTIAPTTVSAIAATPAPTTIPEPIPTRAPSLAGTNIQSQFLGVSIKPAINIPTLTRDIVFTFAGVLLGVLLLDAYVVSRRKIVRIAGHNIAHFLFLSAVVIAAGMAGRGSLL